VLVWATFDSVQGLGTIDRDVRVAGVNVGKIGAVKREGDDAKVELVLNDDIEVHSDARAALRPHTLFEGTAFVDLSPGSPSAPLLSDGVRKASGTLVAVLLFRFPGLGPTYMIGRGSSSSSSCLSCIEACAASNSSYAAAWLFIVRRRLGDFGFCSMELGAGDVEVSRVTIWVAEERRRGLRIFLEPSRLLVGTRLEWHLGASGSPTTKTGK